MSGLDTANPAGVHLPPSAATRAASPWVWVALLAALAGLAGSLFLSLGMGLKACPLCFYQRTFMMSLVAVLGMGLLVGTVRHGRLALLALPLAAAGLGVALFHVYLEASGKLECPSGLFGWGTAPAQSLAVFLVIFALLLVDALRGVNLAGWSFLACVVILGGILALASCTSNPPMPAPPSAPYTKPPDVCRPPFHPG